MGENTHPASQYQKTCPFQRGGALTLRATIPWGVVASARKSAAGCGALTLPFHPGGGRRGAPDVKVLLSWDSEVFEVPCCTEFEEHFLRAHYRVVQGRSRGLEDLAAVVPSSAGLLFLRC